MGNALIVLGICIIIVLGAALPLLRQNRHTPPPVRKTPRDTRNDI